MADDHGTDRDLALYRLLTAKENLEEAEILLRESKYKGANNRAYYAIFHAVNAAHAVNGKGSKSHREAIGNFNQLYVKTGIFPKEVGRALTKAEKVRTASDYDDFYVASKKETVGQLAFAKELIGMIEVYINEHDSL